MKSNLGIFLILLTPFLVWPLRGEVPKSTTNNIENTFIVEEDSTVHIVDSSIILDDAIEHLKNYEGYSSKVYIDVDGSRTIGYGHHLLAKDTFTVITEKVATQLLKDDLSLRVERVQEEYGLNYRQSLALGLFAYNIGIGGLKKAVNNGLLQNIDKLLNYCYYTTTKDGEKIKVRSKKLQERRQYELSLYQGLNY